MTPRDVERLREGLRYNVRMGCALDVAQATADALLALLRRDWATRVLDAWAERNEEVLAPAPVFHRYMFSRVGSGPVCRWTILVGVQIEHFETPEAARHAAALAAWPQLTHEQCQEIGACP